MGYPLIILGAGASFECIDVKRHGPDREKSLEFTRPPVLKNIFDLSRFKKITDRYSEIHPLIADVHARLNRPKFDLEKYLQHLENDIAPNNHDRYKQLIAFRFYIADLFKYISQEFYESANNYQALYSVINDNGRNACFVNFNYDLLLEKSLRMELRTVDDYVKSTIKVIKLHGAADWVFKPVIPHFPHRNNAYEYYLEHASEIKQLMQDKKIDQSIKDGNWNFTSEWNSKKEYYLPAVALPLASKESFVCPPEHIEYLKQAIRVTTSIIIIGWRANDSYLIDLLKQETNNKSIPTLVVSSNVDTAQDVVGRLAFIPSLDAKASQANGFTNFIQSGEHENYL